MKKYEVHMSEELLKNIQETMKKRQEDSVKIDDLERLIMTSLYLCMLAKGKVDLDTLESLVLSMPQKGEAYEMRENSGRAYDEIHLSSWCYMMEQLRVRLKGSVTSSVANTRTKIYEDMRKFYDEAIWPKNHEDRQKLENAFCEWVQSIRDYQKALKA